ncbi:YceI family protein [Falsiroseomonas selenitidurans]|uniref:YceI family protein n=1 Tax=Falsiroseomonas selenitidurans TaxID=2716335 RepID=A0ABX1EHJ8_9PROT|nr:YceI family protein [Falsiroseomonas selenitidurans]NKC34330.1 YceI family protein [Falsiroseomonas selenitidurans]
MLRTLLHASRRAAIAAAALALLPLAAPRAQPVEVAAPSGRYAIDPAHASVTWRLNHWGLSQYTARFTRFDATLDFDAAQPTQSRLSVAIDPLSVRTDFVGPKDFDAEIARDANFLNAGAHPRIGYVSRSIEMTGARTARMRGDLTLLGVTRPVEMEVRFNGSFAEHPIEKVAALGFSGRATLRRSAFGMGFLVPNIGDEVEILVEAEFLRRN